jgi:ABC-type multidrug transport system fused ATPase/permease subunit
VLRKGEVAEKGTHSDLLEKKGVYSELVKTQLAAEEKIE